MTIKPGMVKVSKVTLKSEDASLQTFASIGMANDFIQAHPDRRFEFTVHWENNVSQLGRLTGKKIDIWLKDWATWMLAPEAQLPGDQAKLRRSQSPGLFEHAAKLQTELSTE